MDHALLLPLALLLCACGSAVGVPALSTSVDAPKTKSPGQVTLDLGPLSDDAVCSKKEGLEQLCIDGLRTAIEEGLRAAVDAQFDGQGAKYLAKFRFNKFSHAKQDGGVAVSFAWRFTMVRQDGEPVLMLDEQTTGPDVVAPEADPAPAIGAALNAVLDNIAETMASAEL